MRASVSTEKCSGQATYTYDPETGEATIRMGDAGWHETYRVQDGHAEGLRLGTTEAMWLRACWLATGRGVAHDLLDRRRDE
jgi:hypothetical protein